MGNRLKNALRYICTVLPLSLSQLGWLLHRRFAPYHPDVRPPEPLPTVDAGVTNRLVGLMTHWATHAPPPAEECEGFLRHRFTFLGKTIQTRTPPWQGLDVAKLWVYQLHYFDHARDLALLHPDAESEGAETIHGWMTDWVENNPPGTAIAWDPYPVSLRLMNWSLILSHYGWRDPVLLASMHVQLKHLSRRLEYDVWGNHLLVNAVALCVAGTLLHSPLRDKGVRLLEQQVAAQMLPDGGHLERSPFYHGHVTMALIQAAAALEPVPPWLRNAIEAALKLIHGGLHEDGCRVQFNDGGAAERPLPQEVIALAQFVVPDADVPAKGSQAFPDSGLYRLVAPEGGGTLLAKAGPALADRQPGHAHSDLLSFEYSVGGHRVFINAGTHGYAESPYRDYCRSTAAHNTVCLAGRNQQEHWATFRVARRVHGKVDHWSAQPPELLGSYTWRKAYHERRIAYDPQGFWLIEDVIDLLGLPYVESALHLHPSVSILEEEASEDVTRFHLAVGETSLHLLLLDAQEILRFEGEKDGLGNYFPRFGTVEPTCTFVARRRDLRYSVLGMAIIPHGNRDDWRERVDMACAAWRESDLKK